MAEAALFVGWGAPVRGREAKSLEVFGESVELNELGGDEEFMRLTTRAGLIVERLGIVRAAVGDGLGQQVALFQEAVGELGS